MPKFDFDCIVIGGGAAGLTASGIAANVGAKTMMVESHRLGGDCTWTGCIPSKTILKAGKIATQIKKASRFGLIDTEPEIDFKKVIEHVQQIRDEVYEEADRPEIYEEMGIEVVFGKARFLDSHTIDIESEKGESRRVSAKYFFIATGARAAIPAIEGLNEIPYLTNESLFEMEELPKHLVIVGAGAIGCEMGQALNHLGAKVTIIDIADQVLGKTDPEIAGILQQTMEEDGVNFELGISIQKVEKAGSEIRITLNSKDGEKEILGSHLLMATGRKPNVDSLNLDNAGILYSPKGISVNKSCRTNQRHVYAIGDVSGQFQLTHMSEHMAKVAVTRALLKVPMKLDHKHVSSVVYTSPEVAQLGASETELKAQNTSFEVYRFPYSKIDRAVTEGETTGLIKVFASKVTGKIYGATIVGAHAGELISEYALAMRNGVSLRKLADTIHAYPTWSLGARRAADQWYIRNQSEWSVKWIKRIFGYRGTVPDFSDPDRIV